MDYLAHIAEDGRKQTLQDHLQGTAERAGTFAQAWGAEPWGVLCGQMHDIGKYSQAFQERLRGSEKRVDHSTAGSQELFSLKATPAAFAVAGHHGGLPDGGNQRDDPDMPTLLGRQKKQLPDYSPWQGEVPSPTLPFLPPMDPLSQVFFVKFLHSCLVDADYLDTEAFMQPEAPRRGGGSAPQELLKRLNAHLKAQGFLQHKSGLNGHRTAVLEACIQGGSKDRGLYSLTVPTGGGKTVASLAFALNHAVQQGLDRVIYVIPYCSIIDQTAAVFRSILGAENVVEHHSGAPYNTGEDGCLNEETSCKALATENWDAPVIVTTSVQFFESLYANKPSQCRKLHHIANSVILFDEAQMMPFPCLQPCVLAIGQLVTHYRATAVLCTATQPSLDGLFAQLFPGLKRQELCPNTGSLYQALRRVTFHNAGPITQDALVASLMAEEQALCIVNSRKQAQEIYGKLQGEGNIHLSTLMYPNHRSALLRQVRERLSAGLPCRVVSTSLIEAGVDVDFPAVFRAEAGLDSIIQAGGRCNREGKRDAAQSMVTVFQPEEAPPPLFATNIGAMREATRAHADMGSPEAIQAYFTSLMSLKGEAAMDRYGVLDAFRRGVEGRILPFRTVAERFHMIDSPAKTVYIPLEEGETLVKQLLAGAVSRGLFRQLGQFGVTVYPNHFAALLATGDIEPLDENTGVLRNLSLYSQNTGLSLVADEGKALFG